MTVKKLEKFSLEELAQLLELFKVVKGRTCSAANFLQWLAFSWSNICVSVIEDGPEVVGFTVAVEPSILEPKIGHLPFSSVKPGVPHQYVREGLQIAEDWLKSKGATMYRFESVRSERALRRLYGMTPSKEVLYEKQL